MRAIYEIVTKIETAKLTGGRQFSVQGRLAFEHPDLPPNTSEPLPLALVLPEDLWRSVEVGDFLGFNMDPQIRRPSEGFEIPDSFGGN